MAERAPLAPPRDLAIPEPGSTTAQDILSRAIGRLLCEVRGVVASRASLAPPGDAAAVDRLLVTLLRTGAGPLASVLRRPNVGALVRILRRSVTSADAPAYRELLALLAFELAGLRALPFEVRLRGLPPRLLSPWLELSLETDVDEAVFASGSVRLVRGGETRTVDLETPPERVWRPFHAIDEATCLALEDNNPLASFEAHPDKDGNAVSLGSAPVSRWTDGLREALALIATHLPDLRRELALYLTQVVPVGTSDTQHLSASYREAIGTVYLTLHPNVMTMTEALIHEFQHNKLNALFEVDDVLLNAFSPLFTSPVRSDPRPLHGVLLAVHAFLPVARLYEAMLAAEHPLARHPSFGRRYAEIIAINREGADVVLAHAEPTPVGRGLLEEIARWRDHYAARSC